MSDDAPTFRHDWLTCPSCGKRMDASTSLPDTESSGSAPGPGDITICIKCGEYLRYGEGLHLTIAKPAEIDELPERTRGQLALARFYIRTVLAREQR